MNILSPSDSINDLSINVLSQYVLSNTTEYVLSGNVLSRNYSNITSESEKVKNHSHTSNTSNISIDSNNEMFKNTGQSLLSIDSHDAMFSQSQNFSFQSAAISNSNFKLVNKTNDI